MNAATQRQLARAALLALILLLIFPTILTAISVVATGAVHAAGEQPVAQATATRRDRHAARHDAGYAHTCAHGSQQQ